MRKRRLRHQAGRAQQRPAVGLQGDGLGSGLRGLALADGELTTAVWTARLR
jgi:hypothetical protein